MSLTISRTKKQEWKHTVLWSRRLTITRGKKLNTEGVLNLVCKSPTVLVRCIVPMRVTLQPRPAESILVLALVLPSS